MDKRTTLAFVLIMGLLYLWTFLNRPSAEELERMKAQQDSLALVEQDRLSQNNETTIPLVDTSRIDINDSSAVAARRNTFGSFAAASIGSEQESILENELMKIYFSNKGGRITGIYFKNQYKLLLDSAHQEVKSNLTLMDHPENRFDYTLTTKSNQSIHTSDLYFTPQLSDNTLTFTAKTDDGGTVTQRYILEPNYKIDYDLYLENLGSQLDASKGITLQWDNYLNKLEKNDNFERRYSSVYYKPVDKKLDHCNCIKADIDEIDGDQLKWVSHSNQFFNTTLIADNFFIGQKMETQMPEDDDPELKKLLSTVVLPLTGTASDNFGMTIYAGPNDFDNLHDLGFGLQNIISYGSNIFGTINQWVIRPLFNFLYKIVGSYGWSIILLTFIVKLAVYPLTYRALKSSSKMQALKPELDKIRDKFKDDQTKIQSETMKVYSEFGVNPAGGCFPMLLQMPIWFAMFRFFPADFDFRQQSFLWANDLSAYDVFFFLPFEVPFLGWHISLFALLWSISSVFYTYYNMQVMSPQTQMNDQMKPMLYMQYAMPLMFFFAFNNYASGLSCYFFFSNLLTIIQTVVTKNYIIDNDAIRQQLELNKAKPKKKGGLQQRLQDALQEQQRIAEERQKQTKKPTKKK